MNASSALRSAGAQQPLRVQGYKHLAPSEHFAPDLSRQNHFGFFIAPTDFQRGNAYRSIISAKP